MSPNTVPLSPEQAEAKSKREAARKSAQKRNDDILNAGASSIGKNTGAFNVYRYPQDLADSQHPHYVMFFITARTSDVRGLEVAGTTTALSFDQTQSNRTGTDVATQAVLGAGNALIAGVRAGTAIASSATEAGPASAVTEKAKYIAVAGASAASVGTFATLASDRSEVLLKDAIALYINKNPSVQYAANWADEDLGIIGGAAQQMKGASGFIDGVKKVLTGVGGAAASYVLQQNASDNLGGFGNAAGALSSSAAIVPNPFKAQLFKSMGFREFMYEYTFLPRNEAEYAEVKDIIKTFKLYMHPTLGAEKFIMGYPAEFTIAYYYREGINEELFRISNCALVNLQIEYGGADFTTFKNSNGAPTEISMKLTFKELELLSKERIEVGF